MLNALCHVHDDSSPLFLMFHGYGNDEHEMIRVIEAVGRHDPMLSSANRLRASGPHPCGYHE